MKKLVEALLDSFDRLPKDAQIEAASEILKRSAKFDLPPLTEEFLLQAADSVLVRIDDEESPKG
jgi:hypothetical protein